MVGEGCVMIEQITVNGEEEGEAVQTNSLRTLHFVSLVKGEYNITNLGVVYDKLIFTDNEQSYDFQTRQYFTLF